MRVTEGTSFEQSDGSWCKPEVELDDSDFERVVVEWGLTEAQVSNMPLLTKYKILSAQARMLLVFRQIQAKATDTVWVRSEGAAMHKAVAEELQKLFSQVAGAS